MSRSVRFAAVLGVVGVVATATPASAQYLMGGSGFRQYGYYNYPLTPLFVPPTFSFGYSQRYALSIPGPYGNTTFGVSRAYSYSGTGYVPINPYSVPYVGPSYGGYMTGGSVANPAIDNAQRNFERAQREATALRNSPAGAKTAIYDQWAYEKIGVQGLSALAKPGEQPEALQKALAAADESAVASGEALNHIVVAIVALEGKGAKGASAFLAPNLLGEIRFAGSPAADALNVIRASGQLDIPPAFDTESLRQHSGAIERDFAAVTAPVLLGKAVEQVKLIKFEATLKQAHDAAAPLVRTLPFEDAIAVRRFLNQLDAAVKVLKDPSANGFVNPKWGTEGTNVADFVKHMTKYKLLFGAAGVGDEEAYLALHRGLAAYLFLLGQNVKK